MPGYFTYYANNKTLDLFFGGQAYTAPVTLFFGLSTIAANKLGTVTEPSGNNYSRVSVTNNLTNFPAASTGGKANGTTIAFPTASGSWGTIISIFVSDASSGGNILATIDLPSPYPKVVTTGATPTAAIGGLNLQNT